ncbi:MAG: TMEM165/GDT1 family protein [Myxococcota bacterium]
MQIVLSSALVVALAEIGDKTMLLAIVLAGRFRAPAPIIAGIFTATILNHALAAWVGSAVAGLLDGFWFRLAVALGFFAMALWILRPDEVDEQDAGPSRYGAFLTTTVAFFAAEMGDKTQVATVALGAQHHAVGLVAVGTTLGMMLANVPAVYFGDRMTQLVPLRYVRLGAALLFLGIGAWGLAALYRG